MNEYERYFFDVNGYLIVRNCLTKAQIEDLSDRLEEQRVRNPQNVYGSDRTIASSAAVETWTARSLIEWGGTYNDLIDLPTISPYLESLLGVDYRLDHDYLAVITPDTPRRLYLHGGGQGAGGTRDIVGTTDGGQCYFRYHDGRFFNGLVAVAFELNDVSAKDGGFACIPGSHKANLALPEDWRQSSSQEEMSPMVNRVGVSAGDAIIFTEALSHGTVPWTGKGERRTIFYKYCPHAVAWGPCFYDYREYAGLTQQQIDILSPPSAFGGNQKGGWGPVRKQRESSTTSQIASEEPESND